MGVWERADADVFVVRAGVDFRHGSAVVVRFDHLGDLVVELLEVEVALVGNWDAVADDIEGPVEWVRVAACVEAVA